jgi:hypothetical protein
MICLLPLLVLAACDDPSRYLEGSAIGKEGHQWGTFGEEVVRVVGDAVASPNETGAKRLAAWRDRRAALVEALDFVLPEELYQPARQGLAETIDLVDQGAVPRLTRAMSALLEDVADDEALEAFVALPELFQTAGRDEVHDLARATASASSPEGQPLLVPLAHEFLALLRQHDGVDDDGQIDADEPAELRELMRAAALAASELDLDRADEAFSYGDSVVERLWAAVAPTYDGQPAWVVRADERGLPLVASVSGGVPAPFVDGDQNGQADVDNRGRWLDSKGLALSLAPYGQGPGYDVQGRAVSPSGRLLFEYVEFARSAGGAFFLGLHRMLQAGGHVELLNQVDQLFQPRLRQRDERDGHWYEALAPARFALLEPLFDALWAGLEGFRGFQPNALVAGAERLVMDQPEVVRDLVEQLLRAWDQFSDTSMSRRDLADHNTLLDDLFVNAKPPGAVCPGPYDENLEVTCVDSPGPLVPRLLEGDLARDLMAVLDDERLAQLGPALAQLMGHRDRLSPEDRELDEPIVVGGPETVDNRSVFQRLLHLLHDTNNAHYATEVTETIGWNIENMALLFLSSYCEADEPLVPDLVQWALRDHFSTTRPTPQELTSFILADHSDFLGNPLGREGLPLREHNADVLLALEFTGLNDALRPVVQVFCDHDQLLLLANLLSVLHEHYSTLPGLTTGLTEEFDFYSVERPAGLRGWEAALAAAVGQTQLVPALLRAGAEAQAVDTSAGNLGDELVGLLRHFTRLDQPVFLRFHPEQPERDALLAYDGLSPAGSTSHFNVLFQRLSELLDRWDESDEGVREALEELAEQIPRHFLAAPSWDAPRRRWADFLLALSQDALPVLADWSGELGPGQWRDALHDGRRLIDELEPWLRDSLKGPLAPALLDLALLVVTEERTAFPTEQLLLSLLSPGPSPEAGDPQSVGGDLQALGRVTVALLQLAPERKALNDIARFVGPWLHPDRSPLATMTGDLAQLVDGKGPSVAVRAVQRALAGQVLADQGSPPAAVVVEALATLGRVEPGSSQTWQSEDLAELARQGARLLGDHLHGLERLYAIIGARTQ